MFKRFKNLDEATKVNLCIIGFGIVMLLLLTQIK
jgi:hypothetical protein